MPAYLIAEHIITDAAKFEEYRSKVGATIARYGGRYLTKGASHKMPEGGHWKPERVVIIEFPDMRSLDAWYNSPEYRPLIPIRKQSTSDLECCLLLKESKVRAFGIGAQPAQVLVRLVSGVWVRDGGPAEGQIHPGLRFTGSGRACVATTTAAVNSTAATSAPASACSVKAADAALYSSTVKSS